MKPLNTAYLISSLLLLIVFIMVIKEKLRPDIKYDYYLEIDKDSMYFINKQGDTVYTERYDNVNPTPLQQALNKDNL